MRRCLEALEAQDYAPIEVIVVDNGSVDRSAEMVSEEFAYVKLITFAENRGFSVAVNEGINAASGQLIALLNNDAEPDPHWVTELMKAADLHPAAGFFASKILFYSDKKTIDAFGDGFAVAGFGYKRGWGEPSEKYATEDYVLGACGGAAMYRSSMLRDIMVSGEFFDGDFFAFGEDLDLSLRARLYGYKCIAIPSAVVYHRVRSTAGRGSSLSLFLSHRNFILTVMKNFPAIVILRNLHNIVGYLVISAVADMVINRRLVYVNSYIKAFAMWPRMKAKRNEIQSKSRITPSEFQGALTRSWLSLWIKLGKMSRSVARAGL